jgi:PAP2 superfamily protein
MNRTLFVLSILIALLAMSGPNEQLLTAQTPVTDLTGPAVLDYWGTLFPALGASVENSLRTQVRTTIAQLAMFDAVNAVLDGPYEPFASKPASVPGASPEAAAVRAAYIVARNEFPTKYLEIETAYQMSITRVPGTPQAIAAGEVIGEAAAYEVLDARATDRRNEPEQTGYTPVTGPGAWIPTPFGSATPQTPCLQFVTPFGYDDPARFRPKPPPALDSRTYTADYNESQDLGRRTDTNRTSEQSDTALFWSPSASALWTDNIRSLASSMDLLTAARFEAVGIASVTNALIASWDAKYTYMFWRPVTAIRFGETDGNPETDPDSAWLPFITTPSHPEYPAAHTTVGASALAFYTVWFGTDALQLAFKGNGGVRLYSSVREITAEEGNARVWGGMHWRNSTEVGTAVGSKVGKYTATHLLKRLDD